MLDKIVAAISESRSLIWGPDFGLGGMVLDASQRNELILELTNCFVQNQEYEICIANKWNLNQGTGSETLGYVLKMSNNFFDFSAIIEKVNLQSLQQIFAVEQPFKLNAPRQSSIFLASLRQVCEKMRYQAFHKELLEFIEHEHIATFVDLDEVDKIHTELEIQHFSQVYQDMIEVEFPESDDDESGEGKDTPPKQVECDLFVAEEPSEQSLDVSCHEELLSFKPEEVLTP